MEVWLLKYENNKINKLFFFNLGMGDVKRGQFYLIGAFIIIMILIGYAVIANYSRILGNTKTYDLAEELRIESAYVLEFGTYDENLNITQMQGLLEGFIESYSDVGEIDELYFIFGNSQNITFMGYQQLNETVLVGVEIDGAQTSPLQIWAKTVETQGYQRTGKGIKVITVVLNNVEYDFKLKEGENFYFILSQVVQGEKHVVTNP
jgi:hypothetical protein